MARRNLDWIVGWWSEGKLIDSEMGEQVILTLVGDSDLALVEDDCIVERVVGQFHVFNASANAVRLHARLTVRQENADTGSPFGAGIESYPMADEQFMWHKVLWLNGHSGNAANYQFTNAGGDEIGGMEHPEYSHIDCKVGRRLQGLDRLCLILQQDYIWTQLTVIPTVYYAAWIRVLVKT